MKGSELKPGVLLTRGLVLEVTESDDFYEGRPSYVFVDINDSYYGPLKGELFPDDDYEVLANPGTPRYDETLKRMMAECLDHAKDKLRDAQKIARMLVVGEKS